MANDETIKGDPLPETTSVAARCARVLEQIKERNDDLNAFSQILAETALKEAKLADRAAVGDLPLAGLMVAVKDNIDTVPAICSAGLPHLDGYRPERDAEIVATLRRSGAVITGVTRTDSGAFGVTTPLVKSPNFPDRIAGGSSGGSAAAVAAGLCDVALGTDTGGSIRIPAACCGVFGFKPTTGSVSLDGIRSMTKSYDHVGPLAASIDKLATAMKVIAPGLGVGASGTSSGITIGIPRKELMEAASVVLGGLDDFEEAASRRGVSFRTVRFPSFDVLNELHISLSLREASDLYRDLPDETFSSLPDVARDSIAIGRAVSDKDRVRAKNRQEELSAQIDRLFDEVDYLLMPTLPAMPPLRDERQVRVGSIDMEILSALIRYTAPFNQTGQPVLAFPWRFQGADIPASLQLIGCKGSDNRLLSLASRFI